MKSQKKHLLTCALGALVMGFSAHAMADGYTTTYHYDDINGKVTVTDPNGHYLTQIRRRFGTPDEAGQLVSIARENSVENTPGRWLQLTTIDQDVAGHVRSITQADVNGHKQLTRTYQYDTHWFLIGEDNPETGHTTYVRDAIGQKVSTQVGRSGVTTFTYDANGNVLGTHWPNKESVTSEYDANNQKTLAKRTRENGTGSQWRYAYNANGQVITSTLSLFDTEKETLSRTFKYSYNSLGYLDALTYPDGTAVSYATNPLGQITRVGDFVSGIGYYPSGKINHFTDGNGEVTTYTLNDRLMDTDITVGKGGASLINRHYDYDAVGNTTALTDRLQPNNNKTFAFDSVNELISETWQGRTLTIGYDAFGNITRRGDNQNTILDYTYNPETNQLTHLSGHVPRDGKLVNLDQTLTYDAYGDITGILGKNGVEQNFTYNDQSRLTGVTGVGMISNQPVVIHYYDANGDQLSTTTVKGDNGEDQQVELTLYGANEQLLYKENITTKISTDYFSLNGHIIAKADHVAGQAAKMEDAVYLHDDLLGSPLQQSTPQGAAVWTQPQDYSPYGIERTVKTRGVHVGFIGKLSNADTGISDFGARAYNPLLGRFMQQDPEAVHNDMPFTFNRYNYAANNPLVYKDPKGDFIDGVEQVIGVVSGAITGGIEAGIAGEDSWGIVKGAFIGAAAGGAASFISATMSRTAAQMAVNASMGLKIAAKVVGTPIADGASNALGNAAVNYLTGQKNSMEGAESNFFSGMVPGFGTHTMGTMFNSMERTMVTKTVHATLGSIDQGAVGVGADSAGSEISHLSFSHKDKKREDFGLGQMNSLGASGSHGHGHSFGDNGGHPYGGLSGWGSWGHSGFGGNDNENNGGWF